MALLPPIPKGVITQGFGPSVYPIEPPAWGTTSKALFHQEPGLYYYEHFHTAIDIAAAAGTPILASETGKVIYSGWDGTGGGEKVQVQIRPGVSYSSNHCQAIYCPVGATVSRGQMIARVGDTGAANGYHDHFWLMIDEIVNGYVQHFLRNPKDFLPGGASADDPRIKPQATATYAVIPAGGHIYDAPILAQAHVIARDESKEISLRYIGTAPGDSYVYDGGTSTLWAKVDGGGAAHPTRYVPYYRVLSFRKQ